MCTYLLPDPTPLEKRLAKILMSHDRRLAEWRQFSSGEWFVRLKEMSVKVTVIGRYHPPADNFFQTNLLIDTLRRNGARQIKLILPYFGYARQDRALASGDPVSADFVTRAAAAAGADSILTANLHTKRLADTTPILIESVCVLSALARAWRDKWGQRSEFTVLAPDRGAAESAEKIAQELGCPDTMWIEKCRDRVGQVVSGRLFGRRHGDTCLIVDDMVDTGATIVQTAQLAREAGFRHLYLCAVHAVLSNGALARLRSARFDGIVFSDTLPLRKSMRRWPNVAVVETASFLAAAAKRG
ncbi:MAG: ribose-phosphate diphosphokinase [Patescibacteria group bacterium]|nr:ribose-phosphate diphosphokinase [Patescibacteria group bacterium]